MPLNQQEFFDDEMARQFPELQDIASLAQQLFPAEGLSPAEQEELRRLTARAGRLRPLEQPSQIGSTRIPGNPFSTDLSPVFNAVQRGLVNMINAVREKRLLGQPEKATEKKRRAEQLRQAGREDEAEALEQESVALQGVIPRLESLQSKIEAGQQAQGRRGEFIQDLATTAFKGDIETMDEKEIIKEKEESEKRLKEFGNKLKQKEPREISPSEIKLYMENATRVNQIDMMGLEGMMERYQRLEDSNLERDKKKARALETDITELYNSIVQRSQSATEFIGKMLGISPQATEELLRRQGVRPDADEQNIPGAGGEGTDQPKEQDTQGTPLFVNGSRHEMTLEQYAETYLDGDVDKARQILRNRGVKIGEQ